ncbi:transmembrane protein, putative [Medicago truncatula]|uniref:Transmembrane protein, putative n=1 Tax=Medicago truncatula TaxID=3880 RepID=G7ZVJ0_MEDTR|nr:transmembrane protein, putative [Medicago truncatula]
MFVFPCHRRRLHRRSSPSVAVISSFSTYSLTQLTIANFVPATFFPANLNDGVCESERVSGDGAERRKKKEKVCVLLENGRRDKDLGLTFEQEAGVVEKNPRAFPLVFYLSNTTTRTFLLPLLIITAATLLPAAVLKRRRNNATSLERTTYHNSKIKSREKLKKWNNTNPTQKRDRVVPAPTTRGRDGDDYGKRKKERKVDACCCSEITEEETRVGFVIHQTSVFCKPFNHKHSFYFCHMSYIYDLKWDKLNKPKWSKDKLP